MAAVAAEGAGQSFHLLPVLIMLLRAGQKIVAVLAGAVLAILVAELFFRLTLATPLRWVLPEPPVALFGPDFATGYRHRPDVDGIWVTEHRTMIRTSNLGLRDRDRPLAHGSGPRTVIVGNSIIEALQVDESQTSPAIAEQMVASQRLGAEVVNLGLSGARPAVLVARLQSQGLALAPDLAVVVLDAGDFLSSASTEDQDFTGYRPDAEGVLHLSYGFRNTPVYRFRTSRAGNIFYWLLDHSQVARIVNARKNVGLFAELSVPAAPAGYRRPTMCPAQIIDPYVALWTKSEPADARAVFDALVRDLAAIHHDANLPIIVATRGIEAGCPNLADKRSSIVGAMRIQIEAADLQFVDLDARTVAATDPEHAADLFGFGANLGGGHLNVFGNRIYGEIFADVILKALPP
jgi:hypothetical protein